MARDSKSINVYFDNIKYIIKEESIHNNVINAYGEILLELQELVNPTLEDSAFIFTSTCLRDYIEAVVRNIGPSSPL